MAPERYILVGTGVAAMAAAEAIRSLDRNGEILMIGDEREVFYSRPGLAYFLTGEVTERQLFPFGEADHQQLKARYLLGRVVQIQPQAKRVLLQDGSAIPYSKLLLATGAQAARLNVPGKDLQGVVKLDNLADARHILKLSKRVHKAVVVGGGITALEIAEGLLSNHVEIHYFMRGERYWSSVLDEAESRIVENHLRERGLQIHPNTEVREILGERGKVAGVRTQDGQGIRCELVATAIGILPRKELAQAAGLQTDRGILVNEYLQTSDEDIFAAGDAAQAFDPASGQAWLTSLWTPARLQGRVAGLNMAGQKTPYLKSVLLNVTRLAGITTTIIGRVGEGVDRDLVSISRGDSETWRHQPEAIIAEDSHEINQVRVIIGTHTFMGAVVMGDQSLSRALQHWIAEQADITPIRGQLIQPGAPISAILSNFWNSSRINNDR